MDLNKNFYMERDLFEASDDDHIDCHGSDYEEYRECHRCEDPTRFRCKYCYQPYCRTCMKDHFGLKQFEACSQWVRDMERTFFHLAMFATRWFGWSAGRRVGRTEATQVMLEKQEEIKDWLNKHTNSH